MFDLNGRVAVVTGGNGGIGLGLARGLAGAGARVVIAARNAKKSAAAVAELDSLGAAGALALEADVRDEKSVAALFDAVAARCGRLDILVNNAGTSATGEFAAASDAVWQADFDLKLFAAIRLARLAIPHMKRQGGGRIVNLTNIGAKQPRARSMPTTVTRAAGLAFTKALSKELAPDNILVNTVCIGLVRAGQHEARAARQGVDLEQLYAAMGKDIPLGRVGRAEEVANVIAFLASEAASFVSGTSVNLDGGASAVL